jgi:GMP synthase (glutamine-hydrolysing)
VDAIATANIATEAPHRAGGAHLLVVECEPAAGRARHDAALAALGHAERDGYAGVIRRLVPGGTVDVCYAADDGAILPEGAGLADFDGVVLTGSALNISDGLVPPVSGQVALVRAVFAAGIPMFGSCFGIQLAAVAAGGSVRRNPKGREFGIARVLTPTAAGAGHPLLVGRQAAFGALTIHGDEVETLPPGAALLATNSASTVQAAEIRHGAGIFWGVQYHPEFTLTDMAVIGERLAPRLVAEGHFPDLAAAQAWTAALRALEAGTAVPGLAARNGIPPEVLDPILRRTEIRNWLNRQVVPYRGRRGRA